MNNLLYITWPGYEGIPIGSFTLRFYSLMFLIAFFLGYKIMEYIFRKEGENTKLLDKLLLYTFLGTLIGARLGHCFFYDWHTYYKDHFWEIFLPFRFTPEFQFVGFQGLASHGAFVGVAISLWIASKSFLKKNPLWTYDRMAVVFSLGGVFVRLGNFFNSEIVGKPWDGPFAVLFLKQSLEYGEIVPRHPAQLYEAICYLILFFILAYLFFKTQIKQKQGVLFGIFLVALWTIRFLIEFSKEPQGDEFITGASLNTGQWLSIPFILLGIGIILFANQTAKKTS